MSLTIDVLNIKGEKVGSVELPESVFGVKPNTVVVHEVVTAYLAARRRGTHSTKTRGEVSGGGLKPWKQKHTGRARAGSTRSPLWRHGGITFGPKPRSYVQDVPVAKRRLALKVVLSDSVRQGKIGAVDGFVVAEPKTKKVAEILKALKLPVKSVLVTDKPDATLFRAARNLAGFEICLSKDLNCYGALTANRLLFTKDALDQVVARVGNGAAQADAPRTPKE